MRVDLHNISDITVRIHKSDYDTSGWFTLGFKTKSWGQNEHRECDSQITLFTDWQTPIEDVYSSLMDHLQAAMAEALEEHTAKLAEKEAKKAEEASV
jgi:hypothetical protein